MNGIGIYIRAKKPSFYFLSLVNEKTIDCDIDNKTLKITALKNPLTTKPFTNLSQIKMIIALITSKNNPNVTMVTGNVKKTIMGFTKALSKPKTMAMITDVVKDFTVISSIK